MSTPNTPLPNLRARKERLASALCEKRLREERKLQSDLGAPGYPGGLIHFVRYFWHILEPGREFMEGWALEAMCLHLEAVTRGEIKRLLINVPPGFMKSMLVNVFWPAWEWSVGLGTTRYVTFSYVAYLTQRDNGRFSDILGSDEYKKLWGHEIKLSADAKVKVENQLTGWKFASSVEGVGTGERGDRILADDLHNVKEGESEKVRQETVRWVREGMANRLNDMVAGVIIGIGQRVHEDDSSAAMLADGDYVHLNIPMEFDSATRCVTAIGWEDPRIEDGELAWPERFPPEIVAKLKRTLGPYAYAAQYQQRPTARGGGILKDEWWQPYEVPPTGAYDFEPLFILAALDTAIKEKEENDYSALTVWAVYDDAKSGQRRIILIDGWKKRLSLHGSRVVRGQTEDEKSYLRRCAPHWGVVEWVNFTCSKRKVHRLLIEDSARGHDVAGEIRRLYVNSSWGVNLVRAVSDKIARAHSVVDIFADEMVYAPGQWICVQHAEVGCKRCQGSEFIWRWRDWAEEIIIDCGVFPKGSHDDIVDTVTMALRHLRDKNLAIRRDERALEEEELARQKPKGGSLYPVY